MAEVLEGLVLQLAGFLVPAIILAIVALGLNLQWGHTGLFNAGIAAFMGIGAYIFGMFATGAYANPAISLYHWGPPQPFDMILAALIGMAAAGTIGLLLAAPTLRLRADYLAIATLAFAEIVRLVLKNERRLTGGDQSLAFIPRPFEWIVPASPGWASDGLFIILAIAVALLVFLVLEYVTRAPWGRALRAVREDEEAAMALGKNAFRLKLSSFAIGCAIIGLGGVLTASFNHVLVPDLFVPASTFAIYVVVILGGSGNNRGVILGAFLFYVFGWTTQQVRGYLPSWFPSIDFINQIVVGLLLILVILYRPEGVLPEPKFVPKAEKGRA